MNKKIDYFNEYIPETKQETIAKPNHRVWMSAPEFLELKTELSKIRHDLEKLELRMVIKLGSLLAFAISVLATIHALGR